MPPIENPDRCITLAFALSDEDLNAAMGLLEDMHPMALYPEVWRALVAERQRRNLPGRPSASVIHLAASAYRSLPEPVKSRLRPTAPS